MKKSILLVAILATALISCSKGGLDPEEKEEEKGTVCVSLNGESLTMKTALERMQSTTSGTINLTMTDNYTSKEDLSIMNRGAVINFDLNGKSISVPKVSANADTINIFDNSASGKGAIHGTEIYALKLTNCRMRVKNVTFTANNSAFAIDGKSKVYVEDGCIYVAGLSLAYNTSSMTGGKVYVLGGHYNFHPILDSDASSIYIISVADDIVMKYDWNHASLPDPRCELEAVESDVTIGFSYYGGSTGKGGKGFRRVIEAAGAKAKGFEAYATTTTLANEYISSVDGLIIPGSAAGDDDNRNAYEFKLLDQIVAQKKPVLGICYGHQRINKYKGGTIPSVTSLAPSSTIKHKDVDETGYNTGFYSEAHSITIDKTSKLYELLGNRETIMVNTSHNYALGTIGTGLKVVATAPDGIVEAIESTDGSMMRGVQFHPEGMYNSLNKPEFLPIFEDLVSTARTQKSK